MEKEKKETFNVLEAQKRRWQLTINNYEDYTCLQDVVEELHCVARVQYACGCVELAPTTGHKHLHVYVDFVNAVKGKSICKEFKGAHIVACKGSQEQNVDYCLKQGIEFYETGVKREEKKCINDVASTLLDIFMEQGLSPVEAAIAYPDTADYVVKHFNNLQMIYNAIGHRKTNGKIK